MAPLVIQRPNVATYCRSGRDAARGDDDGPEATRERCLAAASVRVPSAPTSLKKKTVPSLGFSVPSGHGSGTVYPSRTGSNKLFRPLRAAFFPKIGDSAKLTR